MAQTETGNLGISPNIANCVSDLAFLGQLQARMPKAPTQETEYEPGRVCSGEDESPSPKARLRQTKSPAQRSARRPAESTMGLKPGETTVRGRAPDLPRTGRAHEQRARACRDAPSPNVPGTIDEIPAQPQ
eukprot:4696485-Pleurochrysis_carterae.AAC.2